MAVPVELSRVLKRHPVLWLGAGASCQADPPLPSLTELVKKLEADFDWTAPAELVDPPAIIDAWLREGIGTKGDLTDFLEHHFRPEGKVPRPGHLHHHLAALAGAGTFPAIIDTHYDLLLRTALDEAFVSYTPAVLDQNLQLPDRGLRYLSLYGSRDDWSKIILSGNSQEEFDRRYPFLRAQLDVLLLRHPVLFVGSSLRDPRLLRWLAELGGEHRDRLHTWVAILGPGERQELEKHRWADGRSARELLDIARVKLLELPDLPALPAWFQEQASQLTPRTRELVVELQATSAWHISVQGETVTRTPPALLAEAAALRRFAGMGLLCDQSGRVVPEARPAQEEIHRLALEMGRVLTSLLPEAAQRHLAALAGGAAISGAAVLRIRVSGPQADTALDFPWELISVEGRFPVAHKELHLVREVVREGAKGLPETPLPLSVVAHVAAPESPRFPPLDLEVTAYRMARALDPIRDRVRITELGTVEDLVEATRAVRPVLLHFSGHGEPGALVFEDDKGEPLSMQVEQLLNRLRQATDRLPLAVWLSCCYGAGPGESSPGGATSLPNWKGTVPEEPSVAADLHRAGIPQVLGYFGPVPDVLAARVDQELFRWLVETGHTQEAVLRARMAIQQPLRMAEGWAIFPLAWSLLNLYHRGPDHPLIHSGLSRPMEESHALERQPILLEGVEVLPHGFIGRRRLLAQLRRLHREQRRVLGLFGLGGLGKTATMTRLATLLAGGAHWQERVLVLSIGQAPDPRTSPAGDAFRWLWEQVDRVVRHHRCCPSDWKERLEQADQSSDRPRALARALLDAAGDRIVYVDNAERLQELEETRAATAGVPWRSPEVMAFFQALCGDGTSRATRLLTTRYQPADTQGWWEEIPPCPPAEIFRMTAWYPVLQRLPVGLREELAEQRLAGHPRAVQWVDGLLAQEEQRKHYSVSPDDDPEQVRTRLVKPALAGLPGRIDQDLALEALLRRQGEAPRTLLGECTAIGQPVPLQVVEDLGQGSDDLRALGLLTKYAAGEDAWKVHPFVAEQTTRAGLRWTRNGRAVLGRYWKERGFREDVPAALSEALEHLVAAQAWADALTVMVHLSQRYRNLGWYQTRLNMLQQLSAIPWPDDARSRWLRELGDVCDDMSHFAEAEQAHRESLAIYTRVYGTREHADVASSLHGLANVLNRQGRYAEAEQAYHEVLDIDTRVYGTRERADVASSLHGLANVLNRQGRYAEAERAYREALAIYTRVYGTREHADVATSLNGLANVLNRQGRYAEAEQAYREALAIYTRVYGTRVHADMAASLHGLANVLDSQDRYAEAEQFYRKSLAIYTRVYGTRVHANVAASLHGLANAMFAQGKYEAAGQLYEEVIAIEERIFGTRTGANTLPTLQSLAAVLLKQGKVNEALPLALEVWEAALGQRLLPQIINIFLTLQAALSRSGRQEEMQRIVEQLSRLLSTFPKDHPMRKQVEERLGLSDPRSKP